MKCSVQISLDLHTIEDAHAVAAIAVECGVDWLEAGTGLMVEQGLHVVTALAVPFNSRPSLPAQTDVV
jgi:3-keto-L-gulonate-6-phosphate decarboxylase